MTRPPCTLPFAAFAPLAALLACAPGNGGEADAGLVDLPPADFDGTTPLEGTVSGTIATGCTNLLGADATHVYFTAQDTSGQGGGESIFRVGHSGGTRTRLVTSATVSFGSRGGGFAMNATSMSWSSGGGIFRAPLAGGARVSLQRTPSSERDFFYFGDALYFDAMVFSQPGLHRTTDGVVSEHVTAFAGPYAADDTYAYMISGNLQTRVSRFKLDKSSTETEQLALIPGEEMAAIRLVGEWLYVWGPSVKRVKVADGTVEDVVAAEHGPVNGLAIDGAHVWFAGKPDTNGQTPVKYVAGDPTEVVTVGSGIFDGLRIQAAGGFVFVRRGGGSDTLERFGVPNG